MATNIVEPTLVQAKEEIRDEKAIHQPLSHQDTNLDDDSSFDGELPTEEELHTLRRVSDSIPWRVYTIAFVELCERFSYYGTTVVCKSFRSSGGP